MRTRLFAIVSVVGIASLSGLAQVKDFVPVTEQMLQNPSPDDWLMASRTYDNQRFSPLNQINKRNVGQLRMSWVRGLAVGKQETIPIVYRGVMYVVTPTPSVQALDATNGDLLWEYTLAEPVRGAGVSAKSISMLGDLVYWTVPNSTVVALDARTGKKRWEVKSNFRVHSGGSIVVDGKVVTNGGCAERTSCYIAAYDAQTGKEAWKFYTTPDKDDPEGDKSWGGAPVADRVASVWGLPGAYDPALRTMFWGVANPVPYTRRERHRGNANAIPAHAPADLYSNSTVALDPTTGKLRWHYQHIPGDDWDLDANQDRVLLRTAIKPDPKYVKWINPKTNDGKARDVVVTFPEGGGMFTLDRTSGQFLWATPFPNDSKYFYLKKIDLETGIVHLNEDLLVSKFPGAVSTVCFWNATSYWPMAYDPRKNLMYTPYIDNCLEMHSAAPQSESGPATRERRGAKLASDRGILPDAVNGLARVDMATGEIQRWHTSRVPSNGAVVATAGDLLFWGDLNRRFRAYDSDTGKVLWESVLGGTITTSTITYAVNGKQYVAVLTGTSVVDRDISELMAPEAPRHGAPGDAGINPPYGHNAIYVFALP